MELRAAPVATEFFALRGGFTEMTPAIQTAAGACIAAINYECAVDGGYRRVGGHERSLPHSPSDADYVVAFHDATLVVGTTYVYGGPVYGSPEMVYQGNLADGRSIFFTTTGTWNTSALFSGSGIYTTGLVLLGSFTETPGEANLMDDHLAQKNLAADFIRTTQGITGSGSILGVASIYGYPISGTNYRWQIAFRNDAGGTAAIPWRMSPTYLGGSAWATGLAHYELSFTGGSSEYTAGETVTQGGVSAIVAKTILDSGTWGGTAAGRLIIHTLAGGNFAAGAIAGGGAATAAGAQTQVTFAPGGRFEFDVYDFGDGPRIFGCDGKNRPFELIDANNLIFAPINTGMSTFPSFVRAHKKHLFLAYGKSLQHSGIGTPYVWTLLTGAAELNTGDTITGLLSQQANEGAQGALAVFNRNRTNTLYGSSSANWQLVMTSMDTGALPYTVQNIGQAYYLDDRGITSIATSQNFGNFQFATLSRPVQKFINQRRGTAVASVVIPSLNVYRVFFSDGFALSMTVAGSKILGFMPLNLTFVPSCSWFSEDENGQEVVLLGGTDGIVYRLEKGTSFDGEMIRAGIRLAFNHSKSPRTRKRYRRAEIHCDADARASVRMGAEFSYSDNDATDTDLSAIDMRGGGGVYDSTFVWDETYYDQPLVDFGSSIIDGTGKNISLIFSHEEEEEPPHTLTGVVLHYSPRRLER